MTAPALPMTPLSAKSAPKARNITTLPTIHFQPLPERISRDISCRNPANGTVWPPHNPLKSLTPAGESMLIH